MDRRDLADRFEGDRRRHRTGLPFLDGGEIAIFAGSH
jgi:hypothetical protein